MESYLLPTRVECYAGSRADEEPRAVWVEGLRLEVAEVVDRWYQGSTDPSCPAAAYFRVRTADGEIRLLRHDESSRAWFLVERAKSARVPLDSRAPDRYHRLMSIEVKALAPELLDEYLAFFDSVAFTDNPDWSGCYCCFYHHDPREGPFEGRSAAQNRAAAAELVRQGRLKGYLAYRDGRPVGWCNVNDRRAYALLAADKELPDEPGKRIASVVCFVVAPAMRRQGIARAMLERACVDAESSGFDLVEAYPRKTAESAAHQYHGPFELYRREGFVVHRELDAAWIVRKALGARA